MRRIDEIVIHCSDSPDGRNDGFLEIDSWHKARGWKSPSGIHCGYHYIIKVDGVIELGRLPDEIGAHVEGHNGHSLGICLVGSKNFNLKQFDSLRRLISSLKLQFGEVPVRPHNYFDSAKKQGKTCPNFDIYSVI